MSYLAPDSPEYRVDLARFTDPRDLFRAQAAELIPVGLSTYGWCMNAFSTPCVPGRDSRGDIHLPGLEQGVVGWTGTDGVLRLSLGVTDVSRFDAFQFRVVPNPAYVANAWKRYQDLTAVLIDADGDEASVVASAIGNDALAVPSRRGAAHVMLNQLRFPLQRFEGVELRTIRVVELRFDRTLDGVLDVADVAFSRGRAPA